MKEVYFSNSEYNDILNQLNQLMQEADQIEIAEHKVLLYQILQLFDSIHREPLARIQNALVRNPALKQEVESDPTVEKLMSLYDLLEAKARAAPAEQKQVAFIPEDQVTMMTIPKKKDWLDLGDVADLQQNKIYPKNYQKVNFIISKIGTDVFAVQNQCDGSFLPIDQGIIEDHVITCPWHGCQYDLRTGHAVDESNKKIDTFPVVIEDGRILKVEIAYE